MIRYLYTALLLTATLLVGCDRFEDAVVPDKEKIFRKFFGGFDDQTAKQVIHLADGNFIMFGSSTSFSGVNDAADDPEFRLYLVKTDSRGDEIWAQVLTDTTGSITIGGQTSRPGIDAVGIIQTGSGFTLLGNKDKTALGIQKELLIIFTDADGNEISRNVITTANTTIASDIVQTSDGGYMIVGFESNQPNGVMVTRTDASGNKIPFELSTNQGFSSEDRGIGVASYNDQITQEPRFAIFGTSTLQQPEGNSLSGQRKMFLLIIRDDGVQVTYEVYANVSGNQPANAFVQTNDGGFILMGTDETSQKIYLVKVASTGLAQWEQLVRQNDPDPNVAAIKASGSSIIQNLDGGYALVGSLEGLGSGATDIFLDRTDAFGVPMDTYPEPKTYGGPRSDVGGDVVQTPDGGFAVLGSVNLEGTNSLMNLIKVNSSGDLIDF